MKRFFLLLALASSAFATVSITNGTWTLEYADGKVATESLTDCNAKGILLPEPARQRTWKCVLTRVTKRVPDQPKIDCAVSDWGAWTGGAWSECSNGAQSRLETRARSITTPPANGGTACPALIETRTTTQACDMPPPPPTCTAPKPADELRAMACPTSDTQFWNQERSYVSAPYPTCWTPTEWRPTAPSATECLPPPEPPTPPNDAIIVNAGESISSGIAKLKAGGEVIVKPGTYSAFSLKACSADAWCTVRAEIDGTVTVSGLSIGPGNWYTSIEGFKFTGSGQKAINGSFVKLKRDAFVGGPTSGNNVIVQIGSNDRTPGANKVLVEDSWVYGAGGRYKVLVYNSTNVVLRRVVTRTDAGYRNSDGAPEADITVYDSQNVEVQNCIALDGQGSGAYVAVFYNALNASTSTPNATRAWRGNIAINGSGYYMGTEGQANITGLVVEHGSGLGLKYGVSQLKGSGNVYRNLSLVNVKGDGFGIFGGSGSVSNSIVAGQSGKAFNGTSCSTCLTGASAAAVGLKSLLEPVNGKGATITKRIGHDGTLYGEDGFNTTTDEDLWPWPNEARIKADFDTVRAAFGGKSLTDYVRGALQ